MKKNNTNKKNDAAALKRLNKLLKDFHGASNALTMAYKELVHSKELERKRKLLKNTQAAFEMQKKTMSPVKYDPLNGEYFFAQADDGSPVFRFEVKHVSSSILEVGADTEEDAERYVNDLVRENKVSFDRPVVSVHNITVNS